MPGFLKQATASQSRAIGPFVSDTDFKTVQTALTIANTDIKLVVNGGASANKNSGGATHRVNGVYGITFDATDTATVGEMEVTVNVSGALVVFDKFTVVEEAVFDMLYGASAIGYIANQPVDVNTIKTNPVVNAGTVTFPTTATLASTTNITAGTITTATNVTTLNGIAANVITAAAIADGAIDRATFAADTGLQPIRSNTAQAGAATSITLDASASATNSFYVNDLILITGGTGVGQARFITAYVGATKVATVGTWTTNPDSTSTFAILPFDSVPGATAPTAAAVATAVWTDLLAGSDFSTVSSIGKLLKDDIDAAISSRMATYTQPTGFLAATFPTGTVANTTNITAATGVDVTKWLGNNVSVPTTNGVPNVNVKTWNDLATVALPLVPTTAGRTLDVSAGGEAGVDWANVGSPTTVVGLSGTTVKTATDIAAQIGANGAGLTSVGVGTGGIAAGSFAAGAIDAAAIATDAITSAELAASAANKVRDAVTAAACTEPTAVVAASPTLIAAVSWLLTQSRNKITQTATAQTLFADDGSTSIAASTVSDDGTTATRGEFT